MKTRKQKHPWQRVKHGGSFRRWARRNARAAMLVAFRFKWEHPEFIGR